MASIDRLHADLPTVLLRACRLGEKDINKQQNSKYKGKKVNKQDKNIDPVVLNTFALAEEWHEAYKQTADPVAYEQWKQAKHELRVAQRVASFNKERLKAIDLDVLQMSNKPTFWRRLSKYKRKRSRRCRTDESVTLGAFTEYYRHLFSHEDRVCTEQQKDIEEHVRATYAGMQEEDIEFDEFTTLEVELVLSGLSTGKAHGVDNVTHEMLKYGATPTLVKALRWLNNSIVTTGHMPANFNISTIKPIPKKGPNKEPSDFRPISVSTSFAAVFESLILLRLTDVISSIHPNQFGYRRATSCKHAYFVVNETLLFHKHNHTKFHISSLDASKAFDKMWRDGLFIHNKLQNPKYT